MFRKVACVLLCSALIACGGSSGGGGKKSKGPGTVNAVTSCTNDPITDSTISAGVVTQIRSHTSVPSPTYGALVVRHKTNGTAVTMDYMVHEAIGPAKALLVLIAGGQLNAGITGSGAVVTGSGGNFLVRSAHLFAARGFKVVTIDRPDDYQDVVGVDTRGWLYDSYRTSSRHSVDLSTVIYATNTTNLPVVIAGTSRGAISAVAQQRLAAAIALSSPVTSGNGTPVGSASVPMTSSLPVHVLWHTQDGCNVSTPAGSEGIARSSATAIGNPMEGGFNDPAQPDPCQANTVHGFLGVESCAVGKQAAWIDTRNLPTAIPTANAVSDTTQAPLPVTVDLSGFAFPAAGGALTFSLPHSTSALGGTLSLVGAEVTYNPPLGVSNTTDRFVYRVQEANGGHSTNVVSVAITP